MFFVWLWMLLDILSHRWEMGTDLCPPCSGW